MRAVLYVDRTCLYYYGGNIHTPLTLQPPQTVYSDMEIIDADQLKNLILDFVKINKIQQCAMAIFFSAQTCFLKDLLKTMTPEDFEIQKNEFIGYVPFNKVLSVVSTQKKDANTIIAVNRELAYVLRDIFLKLQFEVEMIVPSFALFGDQQPIFNIDTAQNIVKHYSSLGKVSFPLVQQEPIVKSEDQDEFKEQKESKMHLYLMLGGFVILILILIYMVFFFRKAPAKNNAQNARAPTILIVPKVKPSNTPIPSPTVIIAANVRILNGSGIPGQADIISERLVAGGYTKIELGNAPTQESENASIVVKPSVDIFHRKEIDDIITSLGHSTVIRESSEIDTDVLITTRKRTSDQ